MALLYLTGCKFENRVSPTFWSTKSCRLIYVGKVDSRLLRKSDSGEPCKSDFGEPGKSNSGNLASLPPG
nr:hypothetical protein Iba_scaffold67968CG0010 [Ipomoea batatas]